MSSWGIIRKSGVNWLKYPCRQKKTRDSQRSRQKAEVQKFRNWNSQVVGKENRNYSGHRGSTGSHAIVIQSPEANNFSWRFILLIYMICSWGRSQAHGIGMSRVGRTQAAAGRGHQTRLVDPRYGEPYQPYEQTGCFANLGNGPRFRDFWKRFYGRKRTANASVKNPEFGVVCSWKEKEGKTKPKTAKKRLKRLTRLKSDDDHQRITATNLALLSMSQNFLISNISYGFDPSLGRSHVCLFIDLGYP